VKEKFVDHRFLPRTLKVIDQINSVLDEYMAQGYVITIRSLFYQFVARRMEPIDMPKPAGWTLNSDKTYEYLKTTIGDGRLTGLIDWAAIEDRTREVQRWASWSDPAARIRAAAERYQEDPWREHSVRLFVWIEKAALLHTIEQACSDMAVPYFAARGNVSHSELYATGKEFARLLSRGIRPVILYLGDHDPAGINMPRVAAKFLSLFSGHQIEVRRLALTIDQAQSDGLPPNFAKETDKLFDRYVEEFGTEECWELDALDPPMIDRLLRDAIAEFVDMRKWQAAKRREKKNRSLMVDAANNWDAIIKKLRTQ
jgi:hypothetical protein